MSSRWRVTILIGVSLLAHPLRANAADDAGASTFGSGAKLYRERVWTPDQIPVPPRPPPPAPASAEPGPAAGPRFAIRRFDVVGNTLLSSEQVEQTLKPFVGPDRTFSTIEQARSALQQRYADEGFVAIGIAVPQQTVADGSVRLDVVEARVGSVTVQNEGIAWHSEESVRALTPHVYPGAVLRDSDLRADLARANSDPDLHVRPVLSAGKQPGLVDVKLVVDDRIPLHASVSLYDEHTPGSPHWRLESNASYSNLWDAGHSVSLTYVTAPAQSNDVLIGSASYRMPIPGRERDSLMGYWAYSNTTSSVPLVTGLSSLGNGQSFGLRYNFGLPDRGGESWTLQWGLTGGVDYKDIKSTLQAVQVLTDPNDPNGPTHEEIAEIKSPIRYLPLNLTWWNSISDSDDALSLAFIGRLNFSGMVSGGSKEDFQASRGGISSSNPVNGNYQVIAWNHEWRRRLSMADGASWLANLGQSLLGSYWRSDGIPRDAISIYDDWAFVLRLMGQAASQPLVPTEQYAAGGVGTVRGYLQSEVFGDDAWNTNVELWTRRFRLDLLPSFPTSWRAGAFWDLACMYNLAPGEGETTTKCIEGIGLGFEFFLVPWFSSQIYLADPLNSTENTKANQLRVHLRVTGGF